MSAYSPYLRRLWHHLSYNEKLITDVMTQVGHTIFVHVASTTKLSFRYTKIFSIIFLQAVSKFDMAVSSKKMPKSVSDTCNLYHVACLMVFLMIYSIPILDFNDLMQPNITSFFYAKLKKYYFNALSNKCAFDMFVSAEITRCGYIDCLLSLRSFISFTRWRL